MRGSLGEKIGEGAYSDVHAWAPGQVLKLFKAGFPRRVTWWEARMTRAVFAAGGPAPEVFDEVTLEGRFGIVLIPISVDADTPLIRIPPTRSADGYRRSVSVSPRIGISRLDGPTLLQLTRSGAMTFGQAGAILASVCLSVHKTPPPPDVVFLRDSMDGSLRFSGGIVPKHIAIGILALIERLRPGDGLCHGDLHPDNVIMTADGPRLIDWTGAVRAPAAFDLACCHILLTEVAPEGADNPQRPRAVNAAAQSEYARLADMSPAALTAAIEPYLPIVRLRVLLGPAGSPALRDRLIQQVEAALRPGD